MICLCILIVAVIELAYLLAHVSTSRYWYLHRWRRHAHDDVAGPDQHQRKSLSGHHWHGASWGVRIVISEFRDVNAGKAGYRENVIIYAQLEALGESRHC